MEADLTAIASVIQYIDLLVTPDTVVKHIADLMESPLLEISIGEAPFLKQGAYTNGNLVLSDVLSERLFKKGEQTETNITAADIFASTIYFFSNSKSLKPALSNGATLYKISHDEFGTTYIPISGSVDAKIETQRLMSRQFLATLLDNSESEDIYREIVKINPTEAGVWCQEEKAIVTEVMKDLLGTLRSLLQCIETKRSSRDFVNNLGKLISHCETTSSTQIATIIFKTKIESINARSFEENAKEVELLLYELKSYLQKNLGNVKALEEKLSQHKKEEFMQKNGPQLG